MRNAVFSVVTGIGLAMFGMSPVGCNQQAAPPQAAARPTPPTPAPVVGGGQYSPNVDQKFPTRVYWGVAHVHTGYSFDSGMFGVTTTPTTYSGLPPAGKS